MNNKVWAVIKGYSDNCTFTAEEFNSLEIFHNKEEAETRMLEWEIEIFEQGREDYDYVLISEIEIQ
jgi:Ser/Thr protein kinase RdoA (MazF antagonist)